MIAVITKSEISAKSEARTLSTESFALYLKVYEKSRPLKDIGQWNNHHWRFFGVHLDSLNVESVMIF